MKLGYKLNLEKPRTYNDRPQWIKFCDRKLHIPKWFDKYTVRKYVDSKGLGSFPHRLIWQGFDLADIPFDDLPNGFVIKVTHSSTFNIICTDKSKFDREGVLYKCRLWIKAKFLPCYGEWFHGIERFRVIEEYLEAVSQNASGSGEAAVTISPRRYWIIFCSVSRFFNCRRHSLQSRSRRRQEKPPVKLQAASQKRLPSVQCRSSSVKNSLYASGVGFRIQHDVPLENVGFHEAVQERLLLHILHGIAMHGREQLAPAVNDGLDRTDVLARSDLIDCHHIVETIRN